MKSPPLLPEETLRRVVRVARMDGWCLAIVAGGFALVAASGHDTAGALIGLAVAGAGAMELHGVARLHQGAADGLRWLVASQLGVMTVILGYVAWRLGHPDPLLQEAFRAGLTAEHRLALKEMALSEEEFVRFSMRMIYSGVALVTLLFQSGMAFYYLRRRAAVEKALAASCREV